MAKKKLINSPYLIIGVLLFFLVIYSMNLNADPSFLKRTGDIHDEGIYAHNARTAVLFGEWAADEMIFGLTMVPLHAYLNYLVFDNFGIGFAQLRILSVLSGIAILLLTYLFVKDNLGKKQALFTTVFLGLTNAFFIHSRLGRPENLMMMFLMLMFYLFYLGFKKNNLGLYFLSGVSFSLAFLTKVVAIFFLPAVGLFWLLLLFRKEIKFKAILMYGVGNLFVGITFALSYLIPKLEIIVPFFVRVSGNNLFFPLYNIFWFFSNNFYGMPSALLILLFVMFYFISLISKKGFVDIIKDLSVVELMSIAWIIGSLLAFAFGDMSERRFFTLIVPLAILGSRFLFSGKLSFRKTVDIIYNKCKEKKRITTLLVYGLLFFPIFALVYTFITMMLKGTSIYPILQLIVFVSFIILSVIFAFINVKKKILSFLFVTSFTAFAIIPLSTIIRQSVRHILTIKQALKFEIIIGLGITAVCSAVLVAYLFWQFYKKDVLLNKTTKTVFIVIFFMVNALTIGQVLAAPTYSLYDASIRLGEYTEPGDKTISDSYIDSVLSYENEMHPMWYYPFNYSDAAAYSHIHSDIESYDPKLLIKVKEWDGKGHPNSDEWFDKISNLREDAEYVETIGIYQYPFTDSYKIVFDVYRRP